MSLKSSVCGVGDWVPHSQRSCKESMNKKSRKEEKDRD